MADFFLAWQNAPENGGWNPTDWWKVDEAVAEDLLTVLPLLREQRCEVEDLGFENEIKAVGQQWRGARARSETSEP